MSLLYSRSWRPQTFTQPLSFHITRNTEVPATWWMESHVTVAASLFYIQSMIILNIENGSSFSTFYFYFLNFALFFFVTEWKYQTNTVYLSQLLHVWSALIRFWYNLLLKPADWKLMITFPVSLNWWTKYPVVFSGNLEISTMTLNCNTFSFLSTCISFLPQ